MLSNEQAEQVYEIISAMAAWCHNDHWRDELIQFAVVAVALEKADIATAYANAVRHIATAQRYERDTISLDQQSEMMGDALNVEQMEGPPVTRKHRYRDNQKAKTDTTSLANMVDGSECGAEDTYTLTAIIKNVASRLKNERLTAVAVDLAVDVGLEPERQQAILRMLFCGVTAKELGESGYEKVEILRAKRFLHQYKTHPQYARSHTPL